MLHILSALTTVKSLNRKKSLLLRKCKQVNTYHQKPDRGFHLKKVRSINFGFYRIFPQSTENLSILTQHPLIAKGNMCTSVVKTIKMAVSPIPAWESIRY